MRKGPELTRSDLKKSRLPRQPMLNPKSMHTSAKPARAPLPSPSGSWLGLGLGLGVGLGLGLGLGFGFGLWSGLAALTLAPHVPSSTSRLGAMVCRVRVRVS